MAGRPEQLLRRAADRPAGPDHPTAPTETLTCASSDNTLDHAFAPSDRFTFTPHWAVTKHFSTVTKRWRFVAASGGSVESRMARWCLATGMNPGLTELVGCNDTAP